MLVLMKPPAHEIDRIIGECEGPKVFTLKVEIC